MPLFDLCFYRVCAAVWHLAGHLTIPPVDLTKQPRSPETTHCTCQTGAKRVANIFWTKFILPTVSGQSTSVSFFSPWNIFSWPWQFFQKCPWHRKNGRDIFWLKKVAVTLFWVPVKKIPKSTHDAGFKAMTFFDFGINAPVTLKIMPVTFLPFFF